MQGPTAVIGFILANIKWSRCNIASNDIDSVLSSKRGHLNTHRKLSCGPFILFPSLPFVLQNEQRSPSCPSRIGVPHPRDVAHRNLPCISLYCHLCTRLQARCDARLLCLGCTIQSSAVWGNNRPDVFSPRGSYSTNDLNPCTKPPSSIVMYIFAALACERVSSF